MYHKIFNRMLRNWPCYQVLQYLLRFISSCQQIIHSLGFTWNILLKINHNRCVYDGWTDEICYFTTSYWYAEIVSRLTYNGSSGRGGDANPSRPDLFTFPPKKAPLVVGTFPSCRKPWAHHCRRIWKSTEPPFGYYNRSSCNSLNALVSFFTLSSITFLVCAVSLNNSLISSSTSTTYD